MDIPSIKTLQIFEQIAYHGNIAHAAKALHITASAASHQLTKLEKMLGTALFIRSSKGLILTEAGNSYLSEISALLQRLTQATSRVSQYQSDETDTLHIHCTPSIGFLWLLPRLKQFRDQYPHLQVTLSCSHTDFSFTRDNIDIAIRHGFPHWPACEIMTIRHERISVMASPQYLQRYPVSNPAELLSRNLILSESTLMQWPQWFSELGLSQPTAPWLFTFDRSYMSLEAAALGHGLVLESELLAHDYLASGDLIKVFPWTTGLTVNAHHVVLPHGFRRLQRVQIFLQWLELELIQSGITKIL